MKYKVGDKVKVKKNLYANVIYGGYKFSEEMRKYKGREGVITNVRNKSYKIDLDKNCYYWSDEMLELVKSLKIYTPKELINPKIVVYLANKEEWKKLNKEVGPNLCNWHGAHCYSLSHSTYSPKSTSDDIGSYKSHGDVTMVKFNQIKFDDMKKLIGYKIIKEFPTTDDRFKLGFVIKGTLDNPRGWADVVIMAANNPEYFEPVYEDTIKIKGYEPKIGYRYVGIGCEIFKKEFIIILAEVLQKHDLNMDYKEEICKLANYLKNEN